MQAQAQVPPMVDDTPLKHSALHISQCVPLHGEVQAQVQFKVTEPPTPQEGGLLQVPTSGNIQTSSQAKSN
jgi:hypothetical protein